MFFFSPAVDFTLGMFSTGIFNRSTYHLKVKDVRANCFCASLLRKQTHRPRHTSSAR